MLSLLLAAGARDVSYDSMYVLRDFKGGWPPIPLFGGKRKKERDIFFYVGIVLGQKNQNGVENPPPLSN